MAELKLSAFGHGGDYNPDQWRHMPEILDEDIRLMKLAGCNLMSVGIFAWAALEPDEGRYDFDWLETVLNRLHAANIRVLLATPSGARPAWMSQRYPEVLRVRSDGGRNFHGNRHNHCFTSPVYRDFVRRINTALAERFGHHPAVVGWHISNEYGGECHCPLCQEAFRSFLKARYGTLDRLNRAWWTSFWAKTYTDWAQLHSPSAMGEQSVHGLTLNWKRFVTHQTLDFLHTESEPIRRIAPDLPITINLMSNGDWNVYEGLDYFRFGDTIDFSSYDSYPQWGAKDQEAVAIHAAFTYDLTRCVGGGKPWALMESTPSQTNWKPVCKLKKPGMHLLSSLQAVAHGADTVQYFQWRKSRGSVEKFHGAVVDHVGHEHTRTFRDVAQVGDVLAKLKDIPGSRVLSQAAVFFDWDNRWALADCQGPRADMKYDEIVLDHYQALLRQGINVDIIDANSDFSRYRLIAAPMMYMVKPGVAERLETFVQNGGTLVLSCRSGCVDEDDLCFLGGFPGPLRKLAGIWAEETDALYDDERNGIRLPDGNEYACRYLCDLIHPEKAQVLGVYTGDFYQNTPALTENIVGMGRVYYIASCPDSAFLESFYRECMDKAQIERMLPDLPHGVQVSRREGDGESYLFVLNFREDEAWVDLPACTHMLTGEPVAGRTYLNPLEVLVLCQN